MKKLGVNIDHVATLRNARGGVEPDPVSAALVCETCGADGITIHTREDGRHMKFDDALRIRKAISTRLNLEMAALEKMTDFAIELRPHEVCLVPERREEVTTEGGLLVSADVDRISDVVRKLQKNGIVVSLFIDPSDEEIEAAKMTAAEYIELHTGAYANAETPEAVASELDRLTRAAAFAAELGLRVNAGHGLNYSNTAAVAAIHEVQVLNIGHSIISRAVFDGLGNAVREMKKILSKSSGPGTRPAGRNS